MAECSWCKQEMKSEVSCTVTEYDDFDDGVKRARIPYGSPLEIQIRHEQQREDHAFQLQLGNHTASPSTPWFPTEHCHDCSAPVDGYHHPGCDMELCPKCHGQSISCGCTDEDTSDE